MKSRDARFVGTGNFYSEARRPGWKLQCSTCDAFKVTMMPHGILPPDAIIKKFIQAGWFVGKRPEDDQCSTCIAKKKERKEREREEEHRPMQPMQNGNAAAIFQANDANALSRERSFICGIHALLIDGLVDDAISRIESHLPSWPLRKKLKPAPDPKFIERQKMEAEFSQWISEQQKKYIGG